MVQGTQDDSYGSPDANYTTPDLATTPPIMVSTVLISDIGAPDDGFMSPTVRLLPDTDINHQIPNTSHRMTTSTT